MVNTILLHGVEERRAPDDARQLLGVLALVIVSTWHRGQRLAPELEQRKDLVVGHSAKWTQKLVNGMNGPEWT